MGRLGGEEFAVLLPYSSPEDAVAVAEMLRTGIEAPRFDFSGQQASVTASFGVAETTSADDIDALLASADAALYEAKAAGRNCVCGNSLPLLEILPSRRVLKAGQLVFNQKKSVIDCTVRSLAANGAGIDVSTTLGLPKEFELLIRSDRFASRCRVLGQTDRHMDVAFC